MDLGLAGKVAFIGASSQGLGKAVARELVIEGANVVICGRNPETLAETAAELREHNRTEVLALQGDLSFAGDRARIIAASLDKFGSIDIVVTNTGGPPTGKFTELATEQWQATFNLLLASAVEIIQGFLPGMKANAWGRIITITSQAVKQPVNKLILSNSVRASVVGLMKTLASELGEYNITVNNVMPGYTQTARLEKLITANPSFAKVTDEIPLGRFAQPEEFAAAVAFLASARAGYITGVSLAVDGGWIKAL